MSHKRRIFAVILTILILSPAFLSAQEEETIFVRRFQNGAQFYNLSRFQEAAIEFRRAQENAANLDDWSRALYWVILSQMAYSNYGSALMDMEELERRAPSSPYTRDMVYHRARLYYEQGYFEDALILFNKYNSLTTDSDRESAERRAAAFFWMGECLYSLSEFEEAEKFYAWVIGRYPDSPKVEASAYRLDLIKQKKIEIELLALLQWSHEESLRTSEEFQRTIRTYEHTLNLYQRRIAELTNSEVTQESVPSGSQTPSSAQVSTTQASAPVAAAAPSATTPSQAITQTPQEQPESLQERALLLESLIQSILREQDTEGN